MKKYLYIGILAYKVLALLIHSLGWVVKGNSLAIVKNEDIGITPTQIRSIEDIGEWEFLTVSDEELVDTVKYGFFGDSELVRIYYGTLRLGINLREAQLGWLRMDGDTLVAILPPIKLLDQDFIDEAKTRSFFESGSWTQKDRQAMYDRAYTAMRNRCLTEKNIESAELNAVIQFRNMFRNMGFPIVIVNVERLNTQK